MVSDVHIHLVCVNPLGDMQTCTFKDTQRTVGVPEMQVTDSAPPWVSLATHDIDDTVLQWKIHNELLRTTTP
jgi:hypothetical protein